MTKPAKQDKQFHIGIDVAKDKLDIHCLETGDDWQIDTRNTGRSGFSQG